MSSLHSISQFLLSIDGTNQQQRGGRALAEGYVSLDERNSSDILSFVSSLASQIRFYDLNDQAAGDWRPFLSPFMVDGRIAAASELDKLAQMRNDWAPHAALFWAFLKVFHIARNDLNGLVRRHLQYYYEDVLQLPRRSASPDQVHVVFTLAKNSPATKLSAGTLLAAGTSEGLPRQYALESELVVTPATVDRIMSSYIDRNKSGRQILFKAEDATSVVLEDDAAAWRPFGMPQLTASEDKRKMEPAAVGFAVASPALLLSEGRRNIVLSLTLTANEMPSAQMLTSGFEVEFTSEDGWLAPVTMTAELMTDGTLRVEADISEASPSLTAYDSDTHGGNYQSRWAVMRCRLRPGGYLLETLEPLAVSKVEISVSVEGMRNLVLQNDLVMQLPDKPILPFGTQPMIGSNFYIGSPEAFYKSLTSFAVHLEWQDPPPDMADHYRAYGIEGMSNTTTFVASLSLLAGKRWHSAEVGGQGLFSSETASIRTIAVDSGVLSNAISGSEFVRMPEGETFTAFTNRLTQGFIRLELTEPTRSNFDNRPEDAPFEAFGHKSFAPINTRQAIALARFEGAEADAPELPRPPYTPTLKSVRLDYAATEQFGPSEPNGVDEYFIEDLFGPRRVGTNERATLMPDLPGFSPVSAAALEPNRSGTLYVGLKNADPPQAVSMFFHIEEGTAPGDTLMSREEMRWSYLSGSGWIEIDSPRVLEDSTRELQQPGLIRLNIGQDAINDATEMPFGWHWLRLTASDNADGASSILGLQAQAARATLIAQTQGGEQQPLLPETLPAHTVSGLVKKNRAIKSVDQVHSSFGGRPVEQDDFFFRRARERIRHRNRAVSIWDYERIILEQFPEIFKVKCIPHSDTANRTVPGAVRAVIVPDWRKRSSSNPLQPAANAASLRQVEESLTKNYATPFTEVRVTNPLFETLLIDCTVAFHPEFDPGFYGVQLEEEIKRFLSPWAYDEGRDILFGGKVYRSEILAFVEGRDYVDFVLDFQLYHRHSSGAIGGIGEMVIGEDFVIGNSPVPTVNAAAINQDFIVGEPLDIAGATRPESILVSNGYHRINVLQGKSSCPGVIHIGIGQMIIGIDFIPVS